MEHLTFYILIILGICLILVNIRYRRKVMNHFKELDRKNIPIVPKAIVHKKTRARLYVLHPEHRALIDQSYADIRNFVYLTGLITAAAILVVVL